MVEYINYQILEKRSGNFTWLEYGRHLLNEVVKVSIVANETIWNVCSWEESRRGTYFTSVIGLPNTYHLNVITRKHWTNKIAGQRTKVLACNVQSIKINKGTWKLNNFFRWKNSKCIVWSCAKWCAIKDITKKTGGGHQSTTLISNASENDILVLYFQFSFIFVIVLK